MARQIQLRRGNKTQNDAFTGAEGELTMVTDTKGIRLHDGSKQGGYEIPVLVDFQRPTSSNNYTWYRLYSDGWVEQGGEMGTNGTISLPVTMENTNYYVSVSWCGGKSANFYTADFKVQNRTTSSFQTTATSNGSNVKGISWEVKGYTA